MTDGVAHVRVLDQLWDCSGPRGEVKKHRIGCGGWPVDREHRVAARPFAVVKPTIHALANSDASVCALNLCKALGLNGVNDDVVNVSARNPIGNVSRPQLGSGWDGPCATFRSC